MDYKGNVAIEYILIAGMAFIITLMITSFIVNEQELNQAIGAAKTGATEGKIINSFAIYPVETFKTYESQKPDLVTPSSIKIVKIESINQGYNENYGKTKIQLRAYVSCHTVSKPEDRNSLGDRINFHMRKSISQSFSTENLTNSIYNPAFSPKYVYTTADVKWV